MSKKDKLGFSFDERTNVPTYEEVASVFKQHKEKIKKVPKHIILMVVVILIIGGISTTAYVFRDNISENAKNSLTGLSISGFMTNNIDYNDKNKFGYEIKEVEIDLANEEETLKSSLTNNLSSTCEQQKTTLAVNIRNQEKEDCTTEKEVLEKEIISWKNKYTKCNEESDDD